MISTPRQADGDPRDSSQLLSVDDVARRCAVSKRTVYRWLDDGLICLRLPGTGARPILRIDSDDLDQWLGRHRHDFAEEKNDDRKLQLDGRRFFKADTSDARTKTRLDIRVAPASRDRPERSRQR